MSRSAPVRVLLLIASLAGLIGCGNELQDEALGAVDLAPFYQDGATPTNPAGGLPLKIGSLYNALSTKTSSYLAGRPTEYFDFGYVNVTSGRVDPAIAAQFGISTGDSVPKFAPVAPIYFFFDSNGNPLFSLPVKEAKTARWFMHGGLSVRDDNPDSDPSYNNTVYSDRPRRLLTDPVRNSADYQRPIIDDLQDSPAYSGLFEVVEVTAPSGYAPDSIKSLSTLQKGLDDGSFKATRTGAVINCPVLDDRTQVLPTVVGSDVPRPRVEVWYRQKQASCFMVNGWEAIGTRNGDGQLQLYKAGSAASRLSVMDVTKYALGQGEAAVERVVAPVGRLFVPTMTVDNQRGTPVDVRWPQVSIEEGAAPRRTPSDPPGYRPIVWLWDLKLPKADFPYKPENTPFQSASQLDPSQVSPRAGGFTKNVASLGYAILCGEKGKPFPQDPCPALGLACAVDSNLTCAEKRAGFGDYCAPGVAACGVSVPSEDKAAKEFLEKTITQASTNLGYTCHGGENGTGFCYPQCDGTRPNNLIGQTVTKTVSWTLGNQQQMKDVPLPLDDRCGGKLMPGYMCLPIAIPETGVGGRVCLRLCSPRDPDEFNTALCQLPTPVKFSDAYPERDIAADTRCVTSAGIVGCARDVYYQPQGQP